MVYLFLQTIITAKKGVIPYRITLINTTDSETTSFLFRPGVAISKKEYEHHHLDRLELLSAPPFCDLADELIDLFQEQPLVFSDVRQFRMLNAQFKTIGYNFNVRPHYVFHKVGTDKSNPIEDFLNQQKNHHPQSLVYAEAYVGLMSRYHNDLHNLLQLSASSGAVPNHFDLSQYKMAPGVYYFLDEAKNVLYVGKAKRLRKRLQSHFSTQTKASNIDYSKVKSITVEYTGTDLLAQLIESADIKSLQPMYNTQQVQDPAPYIINRSTTAKGITKLQITRKDIKDNMPEKYFNRKSVKNALEKFCSEYRLCRKHCGLEKVKGPCSNVTVKNLNCVCAGTESIENYNRRFDIAFHSFQNQKERKIYKLKGRNKNEDAFVYLVNGIYEGYGFIDRELPISGLNDIMGHLTVQRNNYDTSRIVSGLEAKISPEHIMDLGML